MDVQLVSGSKHDELLEDFDKEASWLRYKDVDQLSMIEACEITSRLIARLNIITPINDEEKASLLKTSIEDYFKNFFVTLQTDNINKQADLLDKIVELTADDLLIIGKKYLDVPLMNAFQEAITLGLQPVEGEPGYQAQGCCSKPNSAPGKNGANKDASKGCYSKNY